MQEPRFLTDDRYPGPSTHPPPSHISGIPTQAELDAYPRMFTWGELKETIASGRLEYLMRNKEMQARYDEWFGEIKREYGGTENYLTNVRLPWSHLTSTTQAHTGTSGSLATTSIAPNQPTSGTPPPPSPPIGRSTTSSLVSASGTSTPSSAGFVSLDSLKERLLGVPRSSHQNGPEEACAEPRPPEYLRYDPSAGIDGDKYAVLFNDWPYNVTYGVRHYCVWSRIPIAHPHLVGYDAEAWARIEVEGLGGFTGVTPLTRVWTDQFDTQSSSSPGVSSSSSPDRGNDRGSALPSDSGTTVRPAASTAATPAEYITLAYPAISPLSSPPMTRPIPHQKKGEEKWYAIDSTFGGAEMRRWAGVTFETRGGEEVGRMVKGLWDERGWECLWFVNPPRLQSVPGFSHFHVFARRKTPEEIDAGERYWGTGEAAGASLEG